MEIDGQTQRAMKHERRLQSVHRQSASLRPQTQSEESLDDGGDDANAANDDDDDADEDTYLRLQGW